MTLIDRLSRLLLAPPATGKKAVVYSIALIATPTLIRLMLSFYTDRLPVLPYLPFVVVAAILLDWRYTTAIALGSWLVADLLFIDTPYRLDFGAYEVIGFIIFVLLAGMISFLTKAVRIVVENSLRPARPDGLSSPVVFSLEGGQAWASWYGSHSWVRLGPEQDVAEMMQDFLAQRELAKRLEASAGSATNP